MRLVATGRRSTAYRLREGGVAAKVADAGGDGEGGGVEGGSEGAWGQRNANMGRDGDVNSLAILSEYGLWIPYHQTPQRGNVRIRSQFSPQRRSSGFSRHGNA